MTNLLLWISKKHDTDGVRTTVTGNGTAGARHNDLRKPAVLLQHSLCCGNGLCLCGGMNHDGSSICAAVVLQTVGGVLLDDPFKAAAVLFPTDILPFLTSMQGFSLSKFAPSAVTELHRPPFFI